MISKLALLAELSDITVFEVYLLCKCLKEVNMELPVRKIITERQLVGYAKVIYCMILHTFADFV